MAYLGTTMYKSDFFIYMNKCKKKNMSVYCHVLKKIESVGRFFWVYFGVGEFNCSFLTNKLHREKQKTL